MTTGDPGGRLPEARAAQLEALLRALPHPVLVLEPATGRVERFGANDRSAVTQGRLEDFFPEPEIRSRVLAAANETVNTGQRQRLEYELMTSAGQRVLEGHTALLSREPVARVLWAPCDVSERRETANRLREREALLETLIESLPFDLWLLDPEGRYTLVNSTARRRWGDPVGKRPADMNIDPEVLRVWEANNARAQSGEVVRGEVSYVLSGEERHYVNILAPVRDGEQSYGVVGLNLDVTDEKRLALELERHQRLESVGVLAGGIAHDFNNYLTVILSGLSVLETQVESEGAGATILGAMQQAVLSARALTRQLLTFARGGAPVRVPTEIGKLVAEAAALAIRGSSCLGETEVEPRLPLVDADAEQLRQVVHNLVLNAVQSMTSGGTVRVVARRTGGTAAETDLIEVAVHDQGIGIPKELLGRVMDPYFTTKEEGHGLGLAICYSIVKQHGGSLSIESEQGRGTSVFVRLPPSSAERVAAAGPSLPRASPARILVMDDDERVRSVTKRLLELIGHRVHVAADCRQMLDRVQTTLAAGDRYDVALFDLVVPGGPDAQEVLRRLREVDSQVPVIVCSGYANSPVMAHFAEHGFAGVLAKPFTVAELQAVLDVTLRAQRAGEAALE